MNIHIYTHFRLALFSGFTLLNIFTFYHVFADSNRMVLGNPTAQYWLWVDKNGVIQKDDDAVEKKEESIQDFFFTKEASSENKSDTSEINEIKTNEIIKTTYQEENDETKSNEETKKEIIYSSQAWENTNLTPPEKTKVQTILQIIEKKEEIIFTRGVTEGGKNALPPLTNQSEEENITQTLSFEQEEKNIITFSRQLTDGKTPSKEIISYRENSKGSVESIVTQETSQKGVPIENNSYELKDTIFGEKKIVTHKKIIFSDEGKKTEQTSYAYSYKEAGEIQEIIKTTVDFTKNTQKIETDEYNNSSESQEIKIKSTRINEDTKEHISTSSTYSYDSGKPVLEKSTIITSEIKTSLLPHLNTENTVLLEKNTKSNSTQTEIIYNDSLVKDLVITSRNAEGKEEKKLSSQYEYSTKGSLTKEVHVLEKSGVSITEISHYNSNKSPSSKNSLYKKNFVISNKKGKQVQKFSDEFLYNKKGEVVSVERVFLDEKGEEIKTENHIYTRDEEGEIINKTIETTLIKNETISENTQKNTKIMSTQKKQVFTPQQIQCISELQKLLNKL